MAHPLLRSTVLAGAALVAGCIAPPASKVATAPMPVVATASVPTTTAASTQSYPLDAAASTLHILVYRGGPMARLGHNHVVSSHTLQGRIWRGTTLEDSGFEITVPVNELVVDEPDARAAEGEDFALPVSEEAKQGTKANMLRESLLDAARYPEIHIRSVQLQGDANTPTVTAALRIRDHTRQVTVPVVLQTMDQRLRVTGQFDIRQTEFGITPLSIAMGALQVVDTLTIKFVLVTQAVPASPAF